MHIRVWIQGGVHVPHVAKANQALHALFNLVEKWNITLGGSTSFPDTENNQEVLLTLSNEASKLKLPLLCGEP
jgi:hypothetical protein